MSKLTAKEKADELWGIHRYYWSDSELETKQRLTHITVPSIIKELRERGVCDEGYWNDVKLEIYRHD